MRKGKGRRGGDVMEVTELIMCMCVCMHSVELSFACVVRRIVRRWTEAAGSSAGDGAVFAGSSTGAVVRRRWHHGRPRGHDDAGYGVRRRLGRGASRG